MFLFLLRLPNRERPASAFRRSEPGGARIVIRTFVAFNVAVSEGAPLRDPLDTWWRTNSHRSLRDCLH